ncbi:DUF397 domain-containing protein [Streptomyces bobili]|uniref:DUF397 domain-containing protein n=1 Tax=Streptomyces bobili TaxID=67280 RepID=UPI00340BBECB
MAGPRPFPHPHPPPRGGPGGGDRPDRAIPERLPAVGNDGPDRVEVAFTREDVRIRDSKNHRSPHLAFAPSEWAAFVSYAADR